MSDFDNQHEYDELADAVRKLRQYEEEMAYMEDALRRITSALDAHDPATLKLANALFLLGTIGFIAEIAKPEVKS